MGWLRPRRGDEPHGSIVDVQLAITGRSIDPGAAPQPWGVIAAGDIPLG